MDEEDWDLWAVVRSCNKSTTAPATAATTAITDTPQSNIPTPSLDDIPIPSLDETQNDNNHDPYGLLERRSNGLDELYEACKPFLTYLKPSNSDIANIVDDQKCDDEVVEVEPPKLKRRRQNQRVRRGEVTKVVKVGAEDVWSMDPWCWRKYGQKPIKGSSNPRSYYKCSSEDGKKYCPAKKYVEQSLSNPEEFIVSYFGHHTHTHNHSHRKPPYAGGGIKISAPNNIIKSPACTWPSSLDTIKEDYEAEQE